MGLPGNMSRGPEPVVARDLVVVVASEFAVKFTVVTSPPVPSPTVVSDDVSWDEVPVLPLGVLLVVPLVPSPPTVATVVGAGVVMVADPPEFDPSVPSPPIAAMVAVGIGDGVCGAVVGEGDSVGIGVSVDNSPVVVALGTSVVVGTAASVGMDVAVAVAVTPVVAVAVTVRVAFVSGTAGSPVMSTQSIRVPKSAGERCRSMA